MGLFIKEFLTSVQALLREGSQPLPKKKVTDLNVVMATFPVLGQTHRLMKEMKSNENCVLFEVCTCKMLMMSSRITNMHTVKPLNNGHIGGAVHCLE